MNMWKEVKEKKKVISQKYQQLKFNRKVTTFSFVFNPISTSQTYKILIDKAF